MQYGLRLMWVEGTRGKGKEEDQIELLTGAGCGSPYLIFQKTKSKGNPRYLILDVRKLVPLLDKALP